LPLAYVTAIVRNERGQILFQRRKDFGDAWWGLPGGVIEPGESPAACVRREVLEETGLRVRPVRLTGLYSSLRYQVTYPNGHQVQQVTLCYTVDVESGSLGPAAGEIEALAFFDPDALPPRPPWYADMLAHAMRPDAAPFFDPPEAQSPVTPWTSLAAVQAAGFSEALPWPVAAVAALDPAGRLLLRHGSAVDSWDLPATPLRVGETLAYTAQRALRAQTGLDLAPSRLLGAIGGYRVPARAGHQPFYPIVGVFAVWLSAAVSGLHGPTQFFTRAALPPLPAATIDLLRQVGFA
jgi:ADP-ribose pyrophosphatase YjhB (NUDIX family)